MRKLMMWGEKEKPTKKNNGQDLKTLEEYFKERGNADGRNKENNHK